MMNVQEVLFLLLVFIAVFMMLALAMTKFGFDPIRKRIGELSNKQEKAEGESELISSLVRVMDPISKLSLPSEDWDTSPLKLKFVNAGWRSPDAPKLYFIVKALLTITFSLAAYFFQGKTLQAGNPSEALFTLILAAAIGYYLPNFVLSRVAAKRKQEIFETLPDATDLLIVCMEAGLSFDQALGKVASEIKIKSEVLCQELELVLMEVRSGFTRERALKNLALRTGIEEIDSLATMVIQSERFGTSIGDALRVHAETARSKRRQKAEETAAKIALKLLFPLIFCLLPAIFIVLLVPSMMQIKEALS